VEKRNEDQAEHGRDIRVRDMQHFKDGEKGTKAAKAEVGGRREAFV
jgi:hypothetical protein